MRISVILLLPAIIFISGCNTYLGREKITMDKKIRLQKIDSEIINTYWQYQIADGKITLTNSAVSINSYDKFVDHPYYYREKYIEYPIKRISLYADTVHKNPSAYFNPFAIIILGAIDAARWTFRWIQYPFAAFTDWNIDEKEGPGVIYRIAYMPFIANCNPFMLPPYIVDKNYVEEHTKYKRSEEKKESKKILLTREIETGIDVSEKRFLFVNNNKITLKNMPNGKFIVNLRKKELIPYMLPPGNMSIRVEDKGNTVIDITVKSTDIIDGESLYLWNIVNDKNANCNFRFSALNKLHSLNFIEDKHFHKIQKDIIEE